MLYFPPLSLFLASTVPNTSSSRYALLSFAVHLGAAPRSGHYVAHVRTEADGWTACNDEKITLCEKAPKDMGYIYLYKRVDE